MGVPIAPLLEIHNSYQQTEGSKGPRNKEAWLSLFNIVFPKFI